MKIKVSELEGSLLAEFVARAQGWTCDSDPTELAMCIPVWNTHVLRDDGIEKTVVMRSYRPDINGGQAMELVKEFDVDVNKLGSSNEWCARVYPRKGMETISDTPEIAICRAVVASKFGEYVEV